MILQDHAGNITEGPGFNVFAVIDGTVVTPERGVLEGITRRTVLEVCAEAGIATETRVLPVTEFMTADEVFISTSGGGAVPLTRVDDRIFSNGAHGPVTARIRNGYWDWMARADNREVVIYSKT